MAIQNQLIMKLLRIITPDEIAEIATKHNGGKFLSLTTLVTERVEQKIYRDFSAVESMDEIHEAHAKHEEEKNSSAKILPFKLEKKHAEKKISSDSAQDAQEESLTSHLEAKIITRSQVEEEIVEEEDPNIPVHVEGENMSSFIMIEKARMKESQKSLKQKEIISLYRKNSTVDVEQIKNTNNNPASSNESGVLVNKNRF